MQVFRTFGRRYLSSDVAKVLTIPSNLFIPDEKVFSLEAMVADVPATPDWYKAQGAPKLSLPVHSFQTGEVLDRNYDLKPDVFGIEVRFDIIHDIVRWQGAKKRAGNAKVKTIAERRGGGRKPWKQKGTGRARQGSIRATQFVGGGRVHGPKPKDWSFSLNKKYRLLAIRSMLSAKAMEENIVVVENMEGEKEEIFDAMKTMKLENKGVVLIDQEKNYDLQQYLMEWDNVVRVLPQMGCNVTDLLRCQKLIITEKALADLETRLLKRKAYRIYISEKDYHAFRH